MTPLTPESLSGLDPGMVWEEWFISARPYLLDAGLFIRDSHGGYDFLNPDIREKAHLAGPNRKDKP